MNFCEHFSGDKYGLYTEGGEKDQTMMECHLLQVSPSLHHVKKDSAAVKLFLHILFIVCAKTVLCI